MKEIRTTSRISEEAAQEVDEIVKIVCEESGVREEDYFSSPIFYYLAGRFPNLTISQCVEIVNRVQNKCL